MNKTLLLCLLALATAHAEETPAPSLKLGQLLRDAGSPTPVYACDLRVAFSQCRQYAVFPGQAAQRLAQIEESCQSLGGTLTQGACPGDGVVARCREVKFRRDVYYDNSYYAGEPARWTPEVLAHVCQHLPGQLELPEARTAPP